MKILAVIAGVFFATLLYLESQHIVNVNWDKLQTISNGVLSTIVTTTNVTSTTGGIGAGPIQAILGNNSTAAANAILPITSTMANLGIPLTSKLNGPFYPSNNDTDAILSYTTKMMSSANPENYLQFNQRKFLEIVEQFYDRMLKVAVNNTIHTLSQLSNPD